MGEAGHEMTAIMKDLKKVGNENRAGRTKSTDRSRTAGRITDPACELKDGGQPAPEALAGWLAG